MGENDLKRIFIVVLLILSANLASSGIALADYTQDLAAAEQAYKSKNYQEAVELYEEIITSRQVSGELYYNLGNAYYRLEKYGAAILNYERAKRLLGKDDDLEVNLKLANLKVPDRLEPIPQLFFLRILAGIGQTLSLRRWAAVLILFEWLVLICLMALHLTRVPRLRKWLVGIFLASAAVLIISGGFFLQQRIQQTAREEGIVLAGSVVILSAPEEGSTELFTLHEGVKFRILREVEGWSEIHLADGKQGWITASAFEKI